MKKTNYLKYFGGLMLIALMNVSCKKDNYYKDGGITSPVFNGTVMDYLHAKPFYFDSVETIVKLAGLDSILNKDSLTFFAPTNRSVSNLVRNFNKSLYLVGKDTIKTLADVPQAVWKKYMSMYIFRGVNLLKDYPQIDFDLLQVYGGQNYLSLNNTVMNIGVTYATSGGVKYVGYRQLNLSYAPNPSGVANYFTRVPVASCNIQPHHAAVHVLADNDKYFAFDPGSFFNDYLHYKQ
ncbi:fasciclin domain-containing protein [Chitinophaga polysaccharea]|uniref:Fasciclin domain-containing protein n=1 Tax=Chitinophaga polysaccharea TaxID=1293035 RepID=A0A561PC41_9BACT|nr:fasciclin domain-containing protein [Chitinophaga polysaccharea]TWF35692.1 fasciclin domain-containing protein [Chitinophaga polysaccharea]